MVDFEKCKLPDGTFDNKKYHELQLVELTERKAKGEICQLPGCNHFIIYAKGYPQTCSECRSLDNPDELNHSSNIRCPKCGYNWSVWEGEDSELFAEGEHEVTCHKCDHEFEVVTSVSYDFQSPERIQAKDQAKKEKE
jgi:hypothetical protein